MWIPGVLSPLCLPISPRGHVIVFIVNVNILIYKDFKGLKLSSSPSLVKV